MVFSGISSSVKDHDDRDSNAKCSIESMQQRQEPQNSFFSHLDKIFPTLESFFHLNEAPHCVLANFNRSTAMGQEKTRMNKDKQRLENPVGMRQRNYLCLNHLQRHF